MGETNETPPAVSTRNFGADGSGATPRRSAVSAVSATIVAPVSTSTSTSWPSIDALARNWPPASAGIEASRRPERPGAAAFAAALAGVAGADAEGAAPGSVRSGNRDGAENATTRAATAKSNAFFNMRAPADASLARGRRNLRGRVP